MQHDFIAEYGNFTENSEDLHHGYLPRNASWYRKHFYLPADWQSDGGATFVHFEGVFHHATFFLNGKYLMSHECGYTGFDVRLDNATGIRFGTGAKNVLTLRADASFGSGHWYEGGGICAPKTLVFSIKSLCEAYVCVQTALCSLCTWHRRTLRVMASLYHQRAMGLQSLHLQS
eukprot:SAG31_NODE_3665_length_4008_cov_1.196726_4_plen_174_part_00